MSDKKSFFNKYKNSLLSSYKQYTLRELVKDFIRKKNLKNKCYFYRYNNYNNFFL